MSEVTLDVVASDVATELFLVDSTFRLAGRGVGRKTFAVPAGIYKIKARCGNTAVEQLRVIRENSTIRLDPILLPSPIPLANTSHADVRFAALLKETRSEGTAIILVPRDSHATVLGLRTLEGKPLPTRRAPIITVPVEPGLYRLVVRHTDDRTFEQTIAACAGWQTVVFLLEDDQMHAAVTMRRPDQPFDENDPDLRLEEIARLALQYGRKILSPELRAHILSPGVPPMLGILGAHLLIREAKDVKEENEFAAPDEKEEGIDNRDAVRTIVENVRAKLVTPHPDIESIAIGAGAEGDAPYIFSAPPMLRTSWRLAIKASAGQRWRIPATAMAAQIGERLFGEGAWLIWLGEGSRDAELHTEIWRAEIMRELAKVARPAAARTEKPRSALSRIDAVFTSRAKRPFPKLREAVRERIAETANIDVHAVRAALDEATRHALVKRFGVPMSRIEAFLDRLPKE